MIGHRTTPPKPAPNTQPGAATRPKAAASSTIVWGIDVEREDFVKVPRVVLQLGRYSAAMGGRIKPRHLCLLFALAARKFQSKPIRAYWEELATDLGVGPGTARKWAYELKANGLLKMAQHRGRDPERNRPGIRNERNSFDLSPFIALVESAFAQRQADRHRRRKGRV